MDQKIKVTIAERDYVLKAPSPEFEELVRLAAAAVNKRLSGYMASFPDRSTSDLLSFVALNECITRMQAQRKLEAAQREADKLGADMEAYLGNI